MVGLETMVKARDKHRYVPTDHCCAQREVPLLCFILMIQWEASRGQVVRSLPRSWPIKTPGRAAGQPGMIYDAIIGEIAKPVPEQSFIRQASHMTKPFHAFVRWKYSL